MTTNESAAVLRTRFIMKQIVADFQALANIDKPKLCPASQKADVKVLQFPSKYATTGRSEREGGE